MGSYKGRCASAAAVKLGSVAPVCDTRGVNTGRFRDADKEQVRIRSRPAFGKGRGRRGQGRSSQNSALSTPKHCLQLYIQDSLT